MSTITLDDIFTLEPGSALVERADLEQVKAARSALLSSDIAMTFLEAIPDAAVVLNAHRQVLAANRRLLSLIGLDGAGSILGLRPGEALGCVHAGEGPGGCGTGPHCVTCGALRAILTCLASRGNVVGECRIQTSARADGGALDLEARASFLLLDGREMVVLAVRDISAEKRRRVLERTFLHDLLNVASGISSAVALLNRQGLEPQMEERARRALLRFSRAMADEIEAHRQLLAAERGELTLQFARVPVRELVDPVAEMYRTHHVAHDRRILVRAVPECAIATDPALVRRVIGNLLKNALEATPAGGTVTLEAGERADEIALSVHNPGAIPDAVGRQIFKRSFSTKNEPGRGIGTYSVKLLTERYLGGRVEFTSGEAEGTRFTTILPKGDPQVPAGL